MFDLTLGTLSPVTEDAYVHMDGVLRGYYYSLSIPFPHDTRIYRLGFQPHLKEWNETNRFGDNSCEHLNLTGHVTLSSGHVPSEEVTIEDVFHHQAVLRIYHSEDRPGVNLFRCDADFRSGDLQWITTSLYTRLAVKVVDVVDDSLFCVLVNFCHPSGWSRSVSYVFLTSSEKTCAFAKCTWSMDREIDTQTWETIQSLVATRPSWPQAEVVRYNVEMSGGVKSPSQVQYLLGKACERLLECVEPEVGDLEAFGHLSEVACASCKQTQSNSLSTLLELAHTKEEITSLIDGITSAVQAVKGIKKGKIKKAVKSLTDLRLSLKWGLPLTVSDASSTIQRALEVILLETNQQRVNKVHASSSTTATGKGLLSGADIQYRRYLTVYYNMKDSRESDSVRWLFDWNFLSFENLWDMIPYSFVVDWFLQLGDNIATVDSLLYRVAFMDMLGSIRTKVIRFDVPMTALNVLTGLNFSGNLTCTYYDRSLSDIVPLPIFSRGTPNLGVVQYVDGGSLILQRV